MCECARCKEMFEEYDLTWIELPQQYYMQVKKKMELVCDKCLEKEKRADP